MTKDEALHFCDLLGDYVFQCYDKNKCSDHLKTKEFFELLTKYWQEFPSSCFYSGTVYRKMNKYNHTKSGELCSCSRIKGTNRDIGFLTPDLAYYQFDCKNGLILSEALTYLCRTYRLDLNSLNPNIEESVSIYQNILNRVIKESEIIAHFSRRNFSKEK